MYRRILDIGLGGCSRQTRWSHPSSSSGVDLKPHPRCFQEASAVEGYTQTESVTPDKAEERAKRVRKPRARSRQKAGPKPSPPFTGGTPESRAAVATRTSTPSRLGGGDPAATGKKPRDFIPLGRPPLEPTAAAAVAARRGRRRLDPGLPVGGLGRATAPQRGRRRRVPVPSRAGRGAAAAAQLRAGPGRVRGFAGRPREGGGAGGSAAPKPPKPAGRERRVVGVGALAPGAVSESGGRAPPGTGLGFQPQEGRIFGQAGPNLGQAKPPPAGSGPAGGFQQRPWGGACGSTGAVGGPGGACWPGSWKLGTGSGSCGA